MMGVMLATISISFLLVIYWKKKHIPKNTYYIIKIIGVIILLEGTVFNVNSYRTFFKDYTKKSYAFNGFASENIEHNQETNVYTCNKTDWYELELNNINTELATMYIDIEPTQKKIIKYVVGYTDATSGNYRSLEARNIVSNNERSKYSTYYLSGRTNSIQIRFYIQEGTEFTFNEIYINDDYPFEFNFMRVDFLIFLCLFIYGIINFKIFEEEYKKTSQKIILAGISTIFIIMCFFTVKNIHDDNNIEYTKDLYAYDFIQALEKGKISLLQKPTEELINMDNPYDYTQNRYNVKQDVAYYNGNYYVYFGILPALILFLPYKLIKGIYLTIDYGVLVFTILSIISLTKLICLIWKKWFSKYSFRILVLELITLLSGCLILWVSSRPMMYELSLTSGLFFASFGLYFILRSTIKEKRKYINISIGCTLLALSVACRPNLLLVSIVVVPYLIKLFIKNIKNRNNITKTILSVCIPYAVIGIALMYYNYIRFDSIFEFGAKYQLTINDMRNLKYRWICLPIGIILQLFKLPIITPIFPFFGYNDIGFDINVFYYQEGMIAGAFILVPICFAIFFIKKIKKSKELYNISKILIIVGLLICSINIMLGGTIYRYSMDYMWLIILASIIIFNVLYENIRVKKNFVKILIITTIYTFILNIFIGGIIGEKQELRKNNPQIYSKIENSICFWK